MTTNPPSSSIILQEASGPSINWHYFWQLWIQRKWLFFSCFIPVMALTIIYLLVAPRVYESATTVQVEQKEQRAFRPTDKEGQPEDLKSEDVLKTIEQNLQNYSLFVDVVTDPQIAGDPNFYVGYPKKRNPPVTSEMATWLRANTKVGLRHGTRLIDVRVEHRVPAMAQKLAQAIINAFILQNIQSQNANQQTALKFLAAQSDEMKKRLQKSENSLQAYKDSLLLRDRIDDQQRVVDALEQRYGRKHPQLVQARMLLADLMQAFDRDFKNVSGNSKSEADYWATNKSDLEQAAPADRIPTELKLVEARAEVLQREVDTESALFDNILKQMRETNVSMDSTATEIRVVEPPPLPEKPAKPKKTVLLLLGLAMGTVVGFGMVLLTHAVDDSVRTPSEAEALFGSSVLGTIPEISPNKLSDGSMNSVSDRLKKSPVNPIDRRLVVLSEPGSAAAEAFRSLRTVISLIGKDTEPRTILFTSALPREGKTFVSCNYALALAQAGLKTLLVDTDLRRPAVHSTFNLNNKIGFFEILNQGIPLSAAIHQNAVEGLDVLTAGGHCSKPAELLAGSGLKTFLQNALSNYDRIIFDGCPVNLVCDSLLIANHVDAVCLVIRASSTSQQAPQHAISLLRRSHREPSGIILNALPSWSDYLYLGYAGKNGGAYRQNYS